MRTASAAVLQWPATLVAAALRGNVPPRVNVISMTVTLGRRAATADADAAVGVIVAFL
ncbi:MAG: hypothetical protein KGL29_03875 [Alphaproteobacteria bacterium]|nr:hypothetical protein [Alphaproteobacteria bacterium]